MYPTNLQNIYLEYTKCIRTSFMMVHTEKTFKHVLFYFYLIKKLIITYKYNLFYVIPFKKKKRHIYVKCVLHFCNAIPILHVQLKSSTPNPAGDHRRIAGKKEDEN